VERRLQLSVDLQVRAVTLTDEQQRAAGRRDVSLMVRAGAGTGKTTVLVERFVGAVTDDGAAVDAILAITFTEKAAAEMKTRVRRRLLELGRRDDARAAEGAWISTIHGFCSRVLRAHALSAGIDPEYRVLDALEAERIGLDAFDRALQDFLGAGEDPRRLEMVASYSPDRLRDMVRTAHSRLRSQGKRRPSLEPIAPPVAAGEHARLDAAVRAALAELGMASGARIEAAIEKLERCEAVLDRLEEDALADPADVDKLELGGGAKALSGAACEEYREALAAYASLCAAAREARDHELLRVLLDRYGERYEERKRARSGLDFEDLELVTRDLLRDHAGLREQYAERFAHILVDEFQDTNPLQNELLGLLERGNLFRVGDENQSIYGFRNADVGVFRSHHSAAAGEGRAESITVNFRTRPEVLDAVDLAFERMWGDEFEPLRPGREPAARGEPAVDLLVVDKHKQRWDDRVEGEEEPFGIAMGQATPWRAVEARLLAKRVAELTADSGPFSYGDVVLLLRATTHMTFYERALEERGIPTHVVGGRGYWSQQQVADLRHWLGALANPLDELSLHSVLASPLVGASLDAVALAALHSRRAGRDAWWTLREPGELADALPADDLRRLTRFVELFERERREAPQVALETLIDRAVTRTGYDRHVLSLPAGERRMANVRKLMRMAREYEAEEGRDLRGFIDFVAERDLIQEREGEAPLEAEGLDAVRLMTVHRAKGLEFPCVCVADLGKDGREDYGSLRISDDGSTGLRLASMSGGSVDTAAMERIREEQQLAGEEEEKRIFYVAVTRAEEHLVLSGATDLERRPGEKPLGEPMRWVWRAFAPTLPGEGPSGVHVDSWDGRELRVAWRRCAPDTLDELLPPGDRAPARPEPEPAGGFEQAALELGAVPAPRALPVSRLSYSALEQYKRCSYRFYVERALRLPPGEEPPPLEPDTVLPARLRGSLVHELLENVDFRRPRVATEAEIEALLERHDVPVRPEDVADLRAMVGAFLSSDLAARATRARRVRTELPFAFTLAPPQANGRTLLVNGVVDLYAEDDDGVLVVDYKSDRLEGREPAELVEQAYATQRLIYALATLRSGAASVEVAHCFLERPADVATAVYEATEAGRLEAELLEAAGGVVEGRFAPAEEPGRELCAGCPAQANLCTWPLERTLA
jgi:ATP-dependent helicase/nuclease subunit A